MQRKLYVAILTAILAVALATAASAAGGSAGMLDPTFGNSGKVETSFGRLTEEGHAVVVQPDGRIVVAGFSSGPTADFALGRYLPDGQLDSSFGNGGKVLTPFPGEFTFINALLLQPDGRIVAVGNTFDHQLALARYLPDGTLDSSFGDGGLVLTAAGDFGYATSAALESDSRIVVAGTVVSGLTPQGYDTDILVMRYLPNGALDDTFGTGGRTTINRTLGDYANAVAIDAAGRIVTAGWILSYPSPWNDLAIARLLPDGQPDQSFGDAGIARADFTEQGSSFSDLAYALVLQPDGKIVAGGTSTAIGASSSGPRFALARFDANGQLDPSFGNGGEVTTIFPDAGQYRDNTIYALNIDPHGDIVAAGATVDTSISWAPMGDFALARYLPDGSLDPSFGAGGRVVTDFGANDTARAIARQADGNLVVAGITSASSSGGVTTFAVARYTGTTPDTTPPTLQVPSGVAVDATSPSGAAVSFTATATDDADPSPSVVCAPASGSRFAIGDTTVSCTATDASGNTATASFVVHLRGAAEQLANLVTVVEDYGLGKLGSSLDDKLVTVQRFLAANKPRQACENLASFTAQVTSQSGKGLSTDQAATLSSSAIRIENVIGC